MSIHGIRGDDPQGDIALDDLSITDGRCSGEYCSECYMYLMPFFALVKEDAYNMCMYILTFTHRNLEI